MAGEKFIALEETSQQIKASVDNVKSNVDGLKTTDVPAIDTLVSNIYSMLNEMKNKAGSGISVSKTYESIKTDEILLFTGLDIGCENDGIIYSVNSAFTQLKKFDISTKKETTINTTNPNNLPGCTQLIYYDSTLFALAGSNAAYLNGQTWTKIDSISSGHLFLFNNSLYVFSRYNSSTINDRKISKVTKSGIISESNRYQNDRIRSIYNTFSINGNTYVTGVDTNSKNAIFFIEQLSKGLTIGSVNILYEGNAYACFSDNNYIYLCLNDSAGCIWVTYDNHFNEIEKIDSKVTLQNLCVKSLIVDNRLYTVQPNGTIISEPTMYLNMFLPTGTKIYTNLKTLGALEVDIDGGYTVAHTGNIEIPILANKYNITVVR